VAAFIKEGDNMGILDGIVGWAAEKFTDIIDVINGSMLGMLGYDMKSFLRYFPAAKTMYTIFVALAIGIIMLNWVWQLFKNFGLIAGFEAEDPIKLSIRSLLFIMLAYFSDEIVAIMLKIGGTPYAWIVAADLPPIEFASFASVITLIISGIATAGVVNLLILIVVIVLGWNYIKLMFKTAERYILLGVLVFVAPVAFAMGSSQSTSNIFKSWCRMVGGQLFLLIMNAWCLRLFANMVGNFVANPLFF